MNFNTHENVMSTVCTGHTPEAKQCRAESVNPATVKKMHETMERTQNTQDSLKYRSAHNVLPGEPQAVFYVYNKTSSHNAFLFWIKNSFIA